jgi:hypothetical protein
MPDPAGHPWRFGQQGRSPGCDLLPAHYAHDAAKRSIEAEVQTTAHRDAEALAFSPVEEEDRDGVAVLEVGWTERQRS